MHFVLNRIMVGLKRVLGDIAAGDELGFESNHGGIETLARESVRVSNNGFESNHGGIETTTSFLMRSNSKSFESNHGGIETNVFRLTSRGPVVARALSGTQVIFIDDDTLYKGWIKVMVEKKIGGLRLM